MAMQLDNGKQMLFNTIRNDLRHQDYKRVTEIADKYKAYISGENIDHLLIQFNPRENAVQFEQRKRLTRAITPYIASRVMTPMYKVGRTIPNKSITWDNKEKANDNMASLTETLNEFAGDESLEEYLSTEMVDLDSTDPNSFIVVEFEGEINPDNPKSKAEPYPFQVNSHEAINYRYKNNKLQFLIVLNKINDLNRYTIYLENEAIVAQQIKKDDLDNYLRDNPNAEVFYKDEEKKDSTEIYIITVAEHKAGRIPAIRVGTRKDIETRKRTCVPLIHPAESFFYKSIKTISEFDLSNSLHVFPQKIQYDEVCKGDLANNIICNEGKLPDGKTCPFCKGSGFNEHKSAADVIRVKMPGDIKDIVSLENFLVYKNPPIELLEFMKKMGLYEYPDLATKAVYTSELYTADQIATTATEKVLDLDSVYDTLQPFAKKWSSVYKYLVEIITTITDINDGITIQHSFPKDFKMKSLSQLLDDLNKANSSGAPSYIKNEINEDIAQKIYIDKPDELLEIQVKQKFFPFNGKTENEIMHIIDNGLTSKFNKVLYANFDMIFDELEQENTTDQICFYDMEMQKQRELLKAKVLEYIAVLDADAASSRADSFNAAGQSDTQAGAQDTQNYNIGNVLKLVSDTSQEVNVIDANPGPNGGLYTIQLSDGSTKEVSGNDLTS